MTIERSQPTDDDHRVVPFRRRQTASRGAREWRWPAGNPVPPAPPDLAKFEGGREHDDDYRHRMLVNTAAVAFTIILASAGAWLATTMADIRKSQDCYLSGRRNCTPIDVQALQRK